MNEQSLTLSITVNRTPQEAFDAINDVRGWWTGEIEGRTDTLGARFTYSHGDAHRSTHEITELSPGEKIVWHVVESRLGFTANKEEWNGTDVVFEIERKGDATEVKFTHVGLVPEIECHEKCSRAWTYFVREKLHAHIESRGRTGTP